MTRSTFTRLYITFIAVILTIVLVLVLTVIRTKAQRPEPFAELHLPYAVITWYSPEPNQQTEFPYGRVWVEDESTGETFIVFLWPGPCDPIACLWEGHISPEYGKSYHIEYAELWLDAGDVWLSTGWVSDSQPWRAVYAPMMVR